MFKITNSVYRPYNTRNHGFGLRTSRRLVILYGKCQCAVASPSRYFDTEPHPYVYGEPKAFSFSAKTTAVCNVHVSKSILRREHDLGHGVGYFGYAAALL